MLMIFSALVVIITINSALLAANKSRTEWTSSHPYKQRHTHHLEVAAFLAESPADPTEASVPLARVSALPHYSLRWIEKRTGTVHRLKISLWVPGTWRGWLGASKVVIHINAEASSASSKQENEFLAAKLLVLIDCIDKIVVRGTAIDTAVSCTDQHESSELVLQKVQDVTDLTEYQYPRMLLLHRREELVEDDHLPRIWVCTVLVGCVWWARFLE